MSTVQIASNPFALMMDPDAVVQAMEQSEHLAHLRRRICRPLDKPLIPHGQQDTDAAAFDREVERTPDDGLD